MKKKEEIMIDEDSEDPLGFFKGCFIAILLSIPIWAVIGYVAYKLIN